MESADPPPQKKRRKHWKWVFWITVILVLYFGFNWLVGHAEALLALNPTVWSFYLSLKAEVIAQSLLGLFYIAFFGALFFLPLPVEGVFIYYLTTTAHAPLALLVVALVGNLLGIIIDYAIGWLIGPRILRWFMRDRYDTFCRRLNKAGSFIVVIGNIIPFPIEPLTLVLGATRYGFIRLLIFTVIGKVIKFAMLIVAYRYFVDHITPILPSLLGKI